METLINELMVSISSCVDHERLFEIQNRISVVLSNYDVQKKSTELSTYTGFLPDCYKVFLVNAKINGLSEKTLKLYNLVLTDFFFKVNKPLEEISVNDIRVYLFTSQQERKISNRTLDSRRIIINGFFEWAANEEYLGKNPCRNIKKIKYTVKERKALTSVQLEKIRNACSNERDRAMIEFLYSTGCRVTELVRLKKNDINLVSKEVLLFGKGNKYRTAYLNDRAIYYLNIYLDSRNDDSEYLFVSLRQPHSNLTKEGVEKVVRTLGEKAGIENVFPHLFRHTTATDCIQRGMPVEDVQKMLGHSNINTTMIYAKVDGMHVKSEHNRCIV